MFKIMSTLILGIALASAAGGEERFGGDLQPLATFGIGVPGGLGGPNAVTEYSNLATFSGQAFPHGGTQNQSGNLITRLVADDVTPMGAAAGADVTELRFSVANLNASSVSVRPRLRFWYADGADGLPGNYYDKPADVGFTFNPITLGPGVTVLTATIAPGTFVMPQETFWAGITFDNNGGATGATLAQMDMLGQGIFGPPTVGSSADRVFRTTAAGSFFGVDNPAGGALDFGGSPLANLGWEFTAVPEPRTMVIFAVLVAAIWARRS